MLPLLPGETPVVARVEEKSRFEFFEPLVTSKLTTPAAVGLTPGDSEIGFFLLL